MPSLTTIVADLATRARARPRRWRALDELADLVGAWDPPRPRAQGNAPGPHGIVGRRGRSHRRGNVATASGQGVRTAGVDGNRNVADAPMATRLDVKGLSQRTLARI